MLSVRQYTLINVITSVHCILDGLLLCSYVHSYMHVPYSTKLFAGENFGRFGTARKLVEKILAADHTNNS